MALAEFTPVKSPVFGMELVPFSFSHRALRSKLIAEKNEFETGFRSGVHETDHYGTALILGRSTTGLDEDVL